MISNESQRVLLVAKSGDPILDISDALNDHRADTSTFTLEDTGYIYVGQFLPFNSRYFDVTTANVNTANLSVEIWNGNEFISTVDVRDRTDALQKSGYLTWRIDRDEAGWACDDTDDITELSSGPRIYRFHWLRISTDTTLTAAEINYLGNLFSTDNEMYSYYPALDNQKTRDQWELASPGAKTDWLEQGFMASENIVRDLKSRNMILESGQILDAESFNTANIHMQAAIIFAGLGGRGFEEDRKEAQKAYEKSMSLARKNIDRDTDGKLETSDRVWSTTFGSR